MTDRNKILDMIAKMSKLTSDSGAFEGEISAASAKIQELMEKYAISQMDVDNFRADQQEKEFKKVFESTQSEYKHKNIQEWEWSLARLIGSITMTRHYSSGIGAYQRYGGSAKMVFFGIKENAAVAAELYALWHKNIWEMALAAKVEDYKRIMRMYRGKKNPFHLYAEEFPDDNPRYFRSSWIRGCLHAMHMKVYEEQKAREQHTTSSPEAKKNSNALVLYKAEVDEAYLVIAKGFKSVSTSGSKGWSNSGYKKGQETGSKIKIGSKQLEE